MHAHSAAHKHRHFKTLILLVVSMTAGAFFLFWLGQLTPVTPLRGKPRAEASWNKISVRTASPRAFEKGFFHLRIDESGRLFQTSAWKTRSPEPRQAGAIQIVLNVADSATGINTAQVKALAKLIGELRKQFGISADQVRLDKRPALASTDGFDAPSSFGL